MGKTLKFYLHSIFGEVSFVISHNDGRFANRLRHRLFSNGQMVATVEPDFVKVGDEVAIKGGRVYLAEK